MLKMKYLCKIGAWNAPNNSHHLAVVLSFLEFYSSNTRPHEHLLIVSSTPKCTLISATLMVAQGSRGITPDATAAQNADYGDRATTEEDGEEQCSSIDRWEQQRHKRSRKRCLLMVLVGSWAATVLDGGSWRRHGRRLRIGGRLSLLNDTPSNRNGRHTFKSRDSIQNSKRIW